MLRNAHLKLATAIVVSAVAHHSPVAFAHGSKAGTLEVVHPWVPPTADPTADVFVRLKIKNTGRHDEHLIGVATKAARSSELNLQLPGGKKTKRNPGLLIKPGTSVEIGAQAPSIVLRGLSKPLSAYDTFHITLSFAKAGNVEIEVMVDE